MESKHLVVKCYFVLFFSFYLITTDQREIVTRVCVVAWKGSYHCCHVLCHTMGKATLSLIPRVTRPLVHNNWQLVSVLVL